MPAVLFGSISTLVDTSELQREAFNEAFDAHGLDWSWSRDEYRSMLGSNGGAQRIADYAAQQGDDVDAGAVHATKSTLYQQKLADSSLRLRPGVGETLRQAKAANHQVGFVTTTSKANVEALLSALSGTVDANDFDVIVHSDHVEKTKPDPAAYDYALHQLGIDAADAVAIEDNAGGVRAALAAGVRVIAFPNENTAGTAFDGAAETAEQLDADHVVGLAAA